MVKMGTKGNHFQEDKHFSKVGQCHANHLQNNHFLGKQLWKSR
jgi:hypothetical protein